MICLVGICKQNHTSSERSLPPANFYISFLVPVALPRVTAESMADSLTCFEQNYQQKEGKMNQI